ncbi:unnamed protein product [Oppiella nova]|uniref:Uncharacterized protein n=1 Tax=Oppiella nova TaxID=334625 RepID=A0A7R9MLG1_9ACAR|nr:unnamed protein product [Oppiella nova]CAG2178651.1 unnamed protein product [Oppiella nova]
MMVVVVTCMQEIFSWNPQWLQGGALIKPPTRKFSQHMQHWPYKLDYENRDEYLCRHFPYIYSQLFISLSEVFKNDAPSRVRHRLYVKDSENCGKHELNKRLDCYVLRDIERHPKPMGRPYDVVILWVLIS